MRAPCFVGEELGLGVETRREDGRLQRHPEIEHVDERLQDRRGDTRGTRRPEGDDPPSSEETIVGLMLEIRRSPGSSA